MDKKSSKPTVFDPDALNQCMHCGFCLPNCPTFHQTGLESYSPRGRIGLMKGVSKGDLPVDAEFAQHMNACLGCRACETACPADVSYGALLESARAVITEAPSTKTNWLQRLLFDHIFPHPERLNFLGACLWFAQGTGLQTLANRIGLLQRLFPKLATMQTLIDPIASPSKRKKRAKRLVATQPSFTVGLFTGCVMDLLFFETNQNTAKILASIDGDVRLVSNQACCGALHVHAGEKIGARALAQRNIEAFEQADVDYIVNNAGGCGAALKEYHHWFADDPVWHERAATFVSRVRDFSELFADKSNSLTFRKPLKKRVTYQDSCHLAHGQQVRHQPRKLLKQIPEIEYVELPFADQCCGSAGIYNLTHYDMSMAVLDEKMEHVRSTDAELIVTSNPGCLLQMKLGIQRAELQDRVQVVHLVDLLMEVL